MIFRFNKHYTCDEANALLPEIRQWLKRLDQLLDQLARQESRLSNLVATGNDVGGRVVNQRIKTLAKIKEVLTEFEAREILLKDITRGIIDFPAIIEDREVFLCWEKADEKVEYWHELDSGFAEREPIY